MAGVAEVRLAPVAAEAGAREALRQELPGRAGGVREVSIVFASMLGVMVLKERLSRGKAVGIAAIVTGAIVLRLV